MSSHWGEIPVIHDTESGIAAIEREQVTKLRPIEVEGPPLHQPNPPCSSRPNVELYPEESFQMDPRVMHTIHLVQHAKQMRQLIHSIQHQQQENGSDGEACYPDAPPVPEYTGPDLQHQLSGPLPFMPRDEKSPFIQGYKSPPPPIDPVVCRKLLRRSVAALCAHLGFDSCAESVLESLTDLTHEHLLAMTRHLRAAVDSTSRLGTTGFPGVMEQVFSEMGLGSLTSLHDFYQQRVLCYQSNMMATCQELMAEYLRLKLPLQTKAAAAAAASASQQDTFHVIRIKDEPHSEIQFPVLDESDDVNEAEQLLQLEGLGGFEITVEHESSSGLTTEVDSKWPQSIRTDQGESKPQSTEVGSDAAGSQAPTPLPSQESPCEAPGPDSVQGPDSIPVVDIMSPPSISPRTAVPGKPKKK